MLGRPIIILSEDVVRNKHGEPISPNDLFGIYLPTLRSAKDCIKEPIVLAYDQSHFCPLLTDDNEQNAAADNFLPLYQSPEHARALQLLPVKFLTNDSTKEQSLRLLRDYLRTQTFNPNPQDQSQPLSLLVAGLGRKRILPENHLFFVYFEYLMDFHETQAKRLKHEEEIRRQEKEYPYSSSEVPQSSIAHSSGNLLNGSPPPSYSTVVMRPDDRRTAFTAERRLSYDQAVSNGTADGTRPAYDDRNGNHQLDARPPQKPTGSVQTTRRPGPPSENQPNLTRVELQRSVWETSNPTGGEESTNNQKSNTNQKGNHSKLKQGRSDFSLLDMFRTHSVTLFHYRVPVYYLASDVIYFRPLVRVLLVLRPLLFKLRCEFGLDTHFLSSSGSGVSSTPMCLWLIL